MKRKFFLSSAPDHVHFDGLGLTLDRDDPYNRGSRDFLRTQPPPLPVASWLLGVPPSLMINCSPTQPASGLRGDGETSDFGVREPLQSLLLNDFIHTFSQGRCNGCQTKMSLVKCHRECQNCSALWPLPASTSFLCPRSLGFHAKAGTNFTKPHTSTGML